mmetsp:Transcript_1761/g.2440  ORF Transcript_1761/g.2440 Transcript_1761/m.2440 type:complete len:184 (+) Transcript_1761:30-581(+)
MKKIEADEVVNECRPGQTVFFLNDGPSRKYILCCYCNILARRLTKEQFRSVACKLCKFRALSPGRFPQSASKSTDFLKEVFQCWNCKVDLSYDIQNQDLGLVPVLCGICRIQISYHFEGDADKNVANDECRAGSQVFFLNDGTPAGHISCCLCNKLEKRLTQDQFCSVACKLCKTRVVSSGRC